MKKIEGGVCAPQGFLANGVFCGIRKNRTKLDLGLVYSKVPCTAAGVFTKNKVQGAPIQVCKTNLKDGMAQAVICNSGIANTCAADGVFVASETCKALADKLGIKKEDVLVASTGVIGPSIPLDIICSGIPDLVNGLGENKNGDFAFSIMTTDTFLKETAVTFEVNGVTCKLGGAAKGSGMINPNMATMLGFLTTDVAISSEMLQKALLEIVGITFNMVSVDGDTSTNDTLTIMANGLAGNPLIETEGEGYEAFKEALLEVCTVLSKMLAKDGEGATKLVECNLIGAPNQLTANVLAKSVISSSLVKAAMFGADANWGRILCALGYAEADFDISKVEVSFISEGGKVTVCENGAGITFDEELAKSILEKTEICIFVDLHQGEASSTAWGCDLTYDYVKINGDYRT